MRNRKILPGVLALSLSATAWAQTFTKGPHQLPNSATTAASANLAPGIAVASADYDFITIHTQNSTYAVASGINDFGLVTGYYEDSSSNFHGFVWRNGALQTVDYPGALDTVLGGVNNSGLTIGYYGNGTTYHTASYNTNDGAWSPLPDIPDYSRNEGYCINDAGVAIGNAFEGSTAEAWIWEPSTRSYSFFAVPGAAPSTTSPSCINDKDQVAGYYSDSNGVYHAFIKEYGTYITIDMPGAADTFADGINDPGILQGQIIDASGGADGFVATPGGLFAIVNCPGAAATAIVGINDEGDLSGSCGTAEFATAQAFVAILKQHPFGQR